MKKYLVFALPLVFIALAACKKKPEVKVPSADFNFDKSEYSGGETMQLINNSSDASRYRWTLPDGQTSKNSDLVYNVSELPANSSLQFKLEAFSESGEKSDYVIKNIGVKPAQGKLILYNEIPFVTSPYTATVSVDMVASYVTTIPGGTNIPDCNATGYLTLSLNVGDHAVTATTPFGNFTANINIQKNKCSKFALKY